MPSQYGDLTIFNAREGDPTAEREAARAEGSKRASYLSSMDQYYAQLDFLKEVETGKREMFSEELAFKGRELKAQETHWGEQIALGREQIGAQEKQWQTELEELRSWHAETAELEREKMTSEEKIEANRLKSTETMFGQTYALQKKELALKAEIGLPVSQIGTSQGYNIGGFYSTPIYGRDASPYGGRIMSAPSGGIGPVTANRWAQESQAESDQSLLDSYLSKIKIGTPTPSGSIYGA